jgi:hypothetical protein
MKRILMTMLLATFTLAAPAAASLMSFDFTFTGNGATATGAISMDTAVLLATPGRYIYDPGAQYGNYNATSGLTVAALTVIVSGSATPQANGTFTLADFDGVLFDTSPAGVNLALQLVGQATVNGTWGTNVAIPLSGDPLPPPQSYTGDFQIFSPAAGWAPYGTNPYELTTGGGEAMQLTSFAPTAVPEPSTYALLCISLGVVGYARRRMKDEG